MGRVDAFLRAGNGNREISMGGRRGNQESVWATLNTDNGTANDCRLSVEASVTGDRSLYGKPRKSCHSCGHKWVDGVQREGEESPSKESTESIRAGDTCPLCGIERQGQDNRVSRFSINTPEQRDNYCEVRINGDRLQDLILGTDDEIIKRVKERGLYDRIVLELFGMNPLLETQGAD